MLKAKQAILTLEDGTEFRGKSFGSEKPVSGEVVFHTAMTGYPETISSPSCAGRILVSTYPMIGNYGVPSYEKNKVFDQLQESGKLHIAGLVIADYSFEFSHWNAEKSLSDWLKEYEIPGIYDVDTRELTKILRERGSMPGKIEFDDETISFFNVDNKNTVSRISCRQKEIIGNGRYRIIVVDCGINNNTMRDLLKRDTTIIRVPWNYDFSSEEYDGIYLSDGPDNPEDYIETVQNIKKALTGNKPIMGVSLGHLLLALAAGAKTYKLKSGHRSHNQPVIMNGTDRFFITSQNHGYAVNNATLPAEWESYFTNLNDGTNEGIKHKTKPFFSVQFQPEALIAPADTEFLTDAFFQNIRNFKHSENK